MAKVAMATSVRRRRLSAGSRSVDPAAREAFYDARSPSAGCKFFQASRRGPSATSRGRIPRFVGVARGVSYWCPRKPRKATTVKAVNATLTRPSSTAPDSKFAAASAILGPVAVVVAALLGKRRLERIEVIVNGSLKQDLAEISALRQLLQAQGIIEAPPTVPEP